MQCRRWVLLGLLILIGCECGSTAEVTQPGTVVLQEEQEQEEQESDGPVTVNIPAPSEAQLASFAAASNVLGFDLYAKTREAMPEGNLALSPASITLAFDMVFAGARGETDAEMRRVMHIEGDASALHEAASRILGRFNDPSRASYELRVVNRLFGEESYTFEPDFLRLTAAHYRAPLEAVDFQGSPDGSRQHINQWVGEQTAERITDLLPPSAINASTRLVLVNAIYFLGTWATPFRETSTAPAPFTLRGGAQVDVPTMHQVEALAHGRVDGAMVVDLPYEGDEFSMTLIIPDAIDGLPALEARLNAETFGAWVGGARFGGPSVSLYLPRFEMRTKVTLSQQLKALGMRQAFTRGVADFAGIANPPNEADRLYISQAFHQVFVAVDEEGTEAAGATAIVMGDTGGPPQPPVEVRADRPFLFAIRDRASGAVLFLGRVTDPR